VPVRAELLSHVPPIRANADLVGGNVQNELRALDEARRAVANLRRNPPPPPPQAPQMFPD
jgi:hypothetical protein